MRYSLLVALLFCFDNHAAEPMTMRVMSFNIRYGTARDGENAWDRRREFLIETIKAFDPDLLGTQETLAFQRDYLSQQLAGYDVIAAGRDDGKEAGEMAALYYRSARFERLGGGHFWLSETPETPGSKGWDAELPRVATWLKLKDRRESAAPPLLIINVHLDHRGAKARAESARLLRRQAVELGAGCRLIITGDFNAAEGSEPYKALFGDDGGPSPVVDTFRIAHPKRGDQEGTFSSFKQGNVAGPRIDWIACSRDWEVKSAGIDRTAREGRTPSDHFPVTAVLQPLATARRVLPPYTRPTLIAHRGASADAPEHTLAAYQLALEHGADFVEPDLQMTRDGVLICLHDTTLERTTNVAQVFPDRARIVNGNKSWPVAEFTLADIQQLDAGAWKAPSFTGQRVPTFQQMIDQVKGKAGLIPETKAPEVYSKLGLNMEAALMAILKKNGLDTPGADPRTPVIIQSFSAESLKALRRDHACRLPLVYLQGSGEATRERLTEIREFADGFGPSKALVLKRPQLVHDAHDLGLSVTVWTFRSGQTGRFPNVRAEMAHFLDSLKVDALFTDNPDQFPRE